MACQNLSGLCVFRDIMFVILFIRQNHLSEKGSLSGKDLKIISVCLSNGGKYHPKSFDSLFITGTRYTIDNPVRGRKLNILSLFKSYKWSSCSDFPPAVQRDFSLHVFIYLHGVSREESHWLQRAMNFLMAGSKPCAMPHITLKGTWEKGRIKLPQTWWLGKIMNEWINWIA